MREAFNALNDIVVQFTTARGSAQRVFEMLDSLPDVDVRLDGPSSVTDAGSSS